MSVAPLNIELCLFRAVDRISHLLRIFPRPLAAADMIGLSQRRTGLSDFGPQPFEESLTVLLEAYDRDADLSMLGRIAARWDALRFLSNLLLLRKTETDDPQILHQRIDQPIFIMGLPRSGTTFLHSLLAEDPANLIPRCWETIYPCPQPARSAGVADPRPRIVDRQLAAFARLAPELRSIHPIDAYSVQECTEITAHVFRSLRYDTTHHIPSYRRWLDHAGHLVAYEFHRRFLQHLQFRKGAGRWVLKSPDHVFAMDAIRTVYPDARLVFVHRDPLKVLPSVAKLTEILRRPFTRNTGRLQIGREVSERWSLGTRRLIETSEAEHALPERIFHLQFRDLVADPIGGAAALYAHFGMVLSQETVARMQDFVAKKPNGGYGRNKYRLEDYGFDAQAERQRYRAYTAHFCIEAET
jgi:hypothetical protein